MARDIGLNSDVIGIFNFSLCSTVGKNDLHSAPCHRRCLILVYCQHKLLTYLTELTVDTKFYWCNSLYTQRDDTSQYYRLLGKGIVFPRTRQGDTWGQWIYATQWHR